MALQASNFPTTKPELTLDFANSRCLDPRITFTRASIGTYVDERGIIQTAPVNVARFDHNPTTGESLGLLVEEARTNLLVRSEEFDNAAWSKAQATISANQTTAPDGTSNADKLIGNATLDVHYAQQSFSGATNGIGYTSSVFAKASELTRLELLHSVGATLYVQGYDLTNGTLLTRVTAGTTAATGGFIQAVGNGWYRCGITQTSDGTTGAVRCALRSANTVAFDATSQGVFLWGAQLEAGAFPTSYIPTVASTVTRAADVASITGSAFSSWYRQDEGTVFAESRSVSSADSTGTSGAPLAFSNGSNTERIRVGLAAIQAQWTAGNVAQATLSSGAGFVANNLFRCAAATKLNDLAFTINANIVQSSTGLVPSVSQLNIGTSLFNGGYLNGTIRRLVYFPARLPNAALQTLTSS
jgi:hypothetical protein